MNNAAKWTMIVGGVLFGLGILFTILSSMGLSDLEPDENWVPDESSDDINDLHATELISSIDEESYPNN